MNLFDALMDGDVEAVNRQIEEEKFKRQAQFMGIFRDTMLSEMWPALVWWFQNGGTHTPECGLFVKGDLLRWINQTLNDKPVRVPTIRYDMLELVVEGKIEVKGVELVKWIGSKLDSNTRNVFIALRRSQNKKK
jgi:hypothetical protein